MGVQILNTDLEFIFGLLRSFENLYLFKAFIPEIVVILFVIYTVVLQNRYNLALPDLILLYLGFSILNINLDYDYIGFVIQKTNNTQFFNLLIITFGFFISFFYLERLEIKAIYLMLLVFLNLFISASNLFTLYICLESSSFCIFLLSIDSGKTIPKIEATIKYFLVTALSSTFILLGLVLIF